MANQQQIIPINIQDPKGLMDDFRDWWDQQKYGGARAGQTFNPWQYTGKIWYPQPQQDRVYWDDPWKVSRWRTAMQSIPPGQQQPDWARPELEQAYQVMKLRNHDLPWYLWRPLTLDDPGRELLKTIPTPPQDLLLPNEQTIWSGAGQKAQQQAQQQQAAMFPYGVDPSTLSAEDWDKLPDWQRIAYSIMSNPEYQGIATMLPFALMGAGAGFMAGGPVGALIGGGGPLLAGAIMGWLGAPETEQMLTERLGKPGQAIASASQLGLQAMNWPTEQVENTVGFLFQLGGAAADPVKYGSLDEVTKNLWAAWQAGRIRYESTPGAAEFSDIFPGIEYGIDMLLRGESDVRFARPGQTLVLGLAEPQTQPLIGWLPGLVAYRRELMSGADPVQTFAKYKALYGFSGDVTDLAIQMVADPFNFMPWMQRKGIEKYANRVDNTALAMAATMARGEGWLGTLRVYGDFLRQGYGPEVAQMTPYQLKIAGLNKSGVIAELQPGRAPALLRGAENVTRRAVENPFSPTTWFDSMSRLTPSTRARELLGLAHENAGVLLEMAGDDPAKMFNMLRSWAVLPPGEARAVAEMLGMPEAVTVRQALAGFEAKLKDIEGMWTAGTSARTILTNLADALGETPATVLDNLRDAGKDLEGVRTRIIEAVREKHGEQRAAALAADQAFTAESLAAMAGWFDEQPWHPQHLRAILHNALLEHTSQWAVMAYGIQPDAKFNRFLSGLKSVQSLLLLGFNPAYAINNKLGNIRHRIVDGVYGLVSERTINQFFDDFGIQPYRLRAGVGAADIGADIDPRLGTEAKTRDLFEQQGYEAATTVGMARGENLIRISQRGGDYIQGFQDAAKKAASYGPVSKWSQSMERKDSAAAMYYGVRQAWDYLWHRNGAIPKLPPGLAGELNRIDPRLMGAIQAAVEHSTRQEDLNAVLGGTIIQRTIDPYIPRLAETMGMNQADLRNMLKSSGVWDLVEKRLAKVSLDDAFQEAERMIQDQIDKRLSADIVTRASQAEATVRAEGFPGGLELFQEIQLKLEQLWTTHFDEWEKTFELAYTPGVTKAQRNALIRERMAIQDREWRAHQDWSAATWSGVLKALGFGDPNNSTRLSAFAQKYAGGLVDIYNSWRKFYANRTKLYSEFVAKMEQVQNYEARDPAWHELQKLLSEMYEATAKKEQAMMLDNAADWVEMWIDRYGPKRAAGAAEWVKGLIQVNNERYSMMNTFRAWERGEPLSQITSGHMDVLNLVRDRDPKNKSNVWPEFVKTLYLPKIAEMVKASGDAAKQMWKDVNGLPEEPPVEPGTPPPAGPAPEAPTAPEPEPAPAPEPEPVAAGPTAEQIMADMDAARQQAAIEAAKAAKKADAEAKAEWTAYRNRGFYGPRNELYKQWPTYPRQFIDDYSLGMAMNAQRILDGMGAVTGALVRDPITGDVIDRLNETMPEYQQLWHEWKAEGKELRRDAFISALQRIVRDEGDDKITDNMVVMFDVKDLVLKNMAKNSETSFMEDGFTILQRLEAAAEANDLDTAAQSYREWLGTWWGKSTSEEEINTLTGGKFEQIFERYLELDDIPQPVDDVIPPDYTSMSDEIRTEVEQVQDQVRQTERIEAGQAEMDDTVAHHTEQASEDMITPDEENIGLPFSEVDQQFEQFADEATRELPEPQPGPGEEAIQLPPIEMTQPQTESEPIHYRVESEQDAVRMLQDVFGYDQERAGQEATLMMAAAETWSKRAGKNAQEFWARLRARQGGEPGERGLSQLSEKAGRYYRLNRAIRDLRRAINEHGQFVISDNEPDAELWRLSKQILNTVVPGMKDAEKILGPTWEYRSAQVMVDFMEKFGHPYGSVIGDFKTALEWQSKEDYISQLAFRREEEIRIHNFKRRWTRQETENAVVYQYWDGVTSIHIDPDQGYRSVLYLPGKPPQQYETFAEAMGEVYRTFESESYQGPLWQQQPERMGYYERQPDGSAIIGAFKAADATTWLHESAHYYFDHALSAEDIDTVREFAGVEDLNGENYRKAQEAFADGYVQWRRDGVLFSRKLYLVFSSFRKFLENVWTSLVEKLGMPADWVPGKKVTAEMQHVYRRIYELDPWEMLSDEYYLDRGLTDVSMEQSRKVHRQLIENRIKAGKPVSERTLAEYPELQDLVRQRLEAGKAVDIATAAAAGDLPTATELLPRGQQMEVSSKNVTDLLYKLGLQAKILQPEYWVIVKNGPYIDLHIETHRADDGGLNVHFVHFLEQNGDTYIDTEMIYRTWPDGTLHPAEYAFNGPDGQERRYPANASGIKSQINMFARNLIEQGFGAGQIVHEELDGVSLIEPVAPEPEPEVPPYTIEIGGVQTEPVAPVQPEWKYDDIAWYGEEKVKVVGTPMVDAVDGVARVWVKSLDENGNEIGTRRTANVSSLRPVEAGPEEPAPFSPSDLTKSNDAVIPEAAAAPAPAPEPAAPAVGQAEMFPGGSDLPLMSGAAPTVPAPEFTPTETGPAQTSMFAPEPPKMAGARAGGLEPETAGPLFKPLATEEYPGADAIKKPFDDLYEKISKQKKLKKNEVNPYNQNALRDLERMAGRDKPYIAWDGILRLLTQTDAAGRPYNKERVNEIRQGLLNNIAKLRQEALDKARPVDVVPQGPLKLWDTFEYKGVSRIDESSVSTDDLTGAWLWDLERATGRKLEIPVKPEPVVVVNRQNLIDHVRKLLDEAVQGGELKNKTLEDLARQAGLDLETDADVNLLYDTMEGALNLLVREERKGWKGYEYARLLNRIQRLEKYENAIPKARRTLTKTDLQQFSTPITISEAAGAAANIRGGDILGEATAGTANLVDKYYNAPGVRVKVNEIDAGRRAVLEMLGYQPTSLDVMSGAWVVGPDGKLLPPFASVMIINPPWGAYTTGKYGRAVDVPVKLNDWSQRFAYLIDRRLAPGGRMVMVMPTNWVYTMDRTTRAITAHEAPFLRWLKETYQVRAIIEAPEGAYDTRATGVSSLLVVYDKIKPDPNYKIVERWGETRPVDWNMYALEVERLPARAEGDVKRGQDAVNRGLIEEERPETGPDATGLVDPAARRGEPSGDPADIGRPSAEPATRPAAEPAAATPAGRPRAEPEPTTRPAAATAAAARPPEPGPAGPAASDVARPADLGGADAGSREPTPIRGPGEQPGEAAGPREPGGERRTTDTAMVERRAETISGRTFIEPVDYSPEYRRRLDESRQTTADSRNFTLYVPRSPVRESDVVNQHPTAIVETKTLAGISYPELLPEHRPTAGVWSALKRMTISLEGQLDPVWAAIQQNDKYNSGVLIADDVGVGKSRTAAAFVIDRIQRGKKQILVITDGHQNVLNLMDREFPGVWAGTANEYGAFTNVPDEFPARRVRVSSQTMKKVKTGAERIPTFDEPTVYFISDHELSVFQDAIGSLDIDVVVVDEVHNFKNVGESQKASTWAVLHHQWLDNKANFLYLSATPGMDIQELKYLYGLRVWTQDGFDDWLGIITGQISPDEASRRRQATSTVDNYLTRIQEAARNVQGIEDNQYIGGKKLGNYRIDFDQNLGGRYFVRKMGDYSDTAILQNEPLAILTADRANSSPTSMRLVDAKSFIEHEYPAPDRATAQQAGYQDAGDINRLASTNNRRRQERRAFSFTTMPAHTEQIMRELKVGGYYISRDISRSGVYFETKEVPLEPQMKKDIGKRIELYREIYAAFHRFGRMNEGPKAPAAMFGINGKLQADSKRTFFNGRLPAVLAETDEALAKGQKVVISIISVSEMAEGGRHLQSAIDLINDQEVHKIRSGEFTDPEDIPEAVIVKAELREKLADLPDVPSPIDVLQNRYGDRIGFITGQQETGERIKAAELFQNDQLDIIVISGAGKTGINLHDITGRKAVEGPDGKPHSIRVIEADYEWSATNFKQGLGRTDRTGEVTSPWITMLHSGSAPEKKLVSTIANRMIGIGATSKGGAESTGVDPLTEQFELGTSLDGLALQETWSNLGDDRYWFMDRYFDDPTTPGIKRLTIEPTEQTLKRFLLALQTMPIEVGNKIWNSFSGKREELIASGGVEQDRARMATKGRGKIERTTKLGKNLELHELNLGDGERYSLLTGILTPVANQVRNIIAPSHEQNVLYGTASPQSWMRWLQFYDAEQNRYLSGLIVRPTYVQRLAAAFGAQMGGGHRPETVLRDMQLGDRIPINGARLSEWELYIGKGGSREGRIVVENARMADREALMQNGAAYNAVGSFFYVTEDNLQKFLARFPIREEQPEPPSPDRLYQMTPEGIPEPTEAAARYAEAAVPDDYSVMWMPRDIQIGQYYIRGLVFRGKKFVAYVPEKFSTLRTFKTEQGLARLLGVDGAGSWVIARESNNWEPEKIKARPDDTDAPAELVAPGTVEAVSGVEYDSQAQQDAMSTWLRPAMTELRKQMHEDPELFQGDLGQQVNSLSGDGKRELKHWINTSKQEMAKAKLAAIRYGERKRDFSLLNYSRRYGFDNTLAGIWPYQFFYTRQMLHWMMRMADRPALLSWYARLMGFMSTYEDDNKPSRLRNKVRIPAPYLPEWAGGGLYVDPLGKLFPFAEFARPIDSFFQQRDRNQQAIENNLQEMVEMEKITPEQAQAALQTRKGPIYDQATALAQQDDYGQDAMDYLSLFTSPALYLSMPYQAAQGKLGKSQPLPLSRQIQAVSSLLDLPGLRKADLEARIRQGQGLSEFGQWGEYYVDRQLANMTAEGLITTDQAIQAMTERKGDAFEQAYERVRLEMALRQPMASTIMAAKQGDAAGMVGSLLFGYLPTGLLPEGELELRQLKGKWEQARAAYNSGNQDALKDFFADHPEYEARLALYDAPDERLKQFLISQVWDKYAALPDLSKREARDQLGRVFNEQFLDGETRDYDTLNPATLAMWSRALGGWAPEGTAETGLTFSNENITQAYQSYVDERKARFPGLTELQNRYFNGETQLQKQLEPYWNWRDRYLADHPEIIKLATSEESALAGADQATAALVYEFRAARAQNFPGIFDIQDRYFDRKSSEAKRSYLAKHPELIQYWEWQRAAMQQHPEIIPYIKSVESIARYVLGEDYIEPGQGSAPQGSEPLTQQQAMSLFPPTLMRTLYGYYFAGDALGKGSANTLQRIWTQLGKPGGTLQEWVDGQLKQTFVTGPEVPYYSPYLSSP